MMQVSSKDRTTPAKAGVDLAAEIATLAALDLQQLRVRWRKLLRSAPPEHLSRSLLVRILAYKIQAHVLGELDRETARYLDRVARDQARRRKAGERRQPKAPPPVPPVPVRRRLKDGTLLAREFGGQMHSVTVVPDGFAWNGSTYTSLSEIARLITGTRWNGPRFFGLRDTRTGSEEARP
jgi:Protein of unknown function (DUF2924)